MQRKFLTNLGLLLLLNLLIKPLWVFGIDLTVQNVTGVGNYGFYFVIFNFSFLFNILLDLGITNFNNRNIAQNHHLLNKHLSSILILRFLLAFVYFSITFLVAYLLGYDGKQMKLLGFLAFNQFLISFILYLRSNVSGLLMFKTDSVLSVLDRMLMIFFCAVLLWGNITHEPFRIEWFVYSQTTAYILTVLTAFLIVVRKARLKRLNWSPPFFLMIIKRSAPFALLFLLMSLYNRIDPIMLESILDEPFGNEQAGIYASGYRLLDAANMIAFLFSGMLLPIFARMLKNQEPVVKILKLASTLLLTIAVIVACGSFFYSIEMMELLYRAHVRESSNVFHILMCGFVPISVTYIFGTLLTANGNLKYLNLIALTGVLMNVILNMILIPRYNAVGSAFTSLITQSVTALLQVLLTIRVFRLKLHSRFVILFGSFIIGVILINIVSRQLPLFWTYNFGIMLVASLLLAFGLRLFSIRSLLQILRNR